MIGCYEDSAATTAKMIDCWGSVKKLARWIAAHSTRPRDAAEIRLALARVGLEPS